MVIPLTACRLVLHLFDRVEEGAGQPGVAHGAVVALHVGVLLRLARLDVLDPDVLSFRPVQKRAADVLGAVRSEEHTSELQSLMRNSYAVFCLKKKKKTHKTQIQNKMI